VRAKPEFHGFLIGKKGVNIRELREQTGARVIFPASGDADQELITIVGKKDSIEKARKDLEAKIANLVCLSMLALNRICKICRTRFYFYDLPFFFSNIELYSNILFDSRISAVVLFNCQSLSNIVAFIIFFLVNYHDCW